jgi:two-component system sensor histidine kinase/response regulator
MQEKPTLSGIAPSQESRVLFLHWIYHNSTRYAVLAAVFTVAVIVAAGWFVDRDYQVQRESELSKALDYFSSTLEAGTSDSRAMGALILLGAQSRSVQALAGAQAPQVTGDGRGGKIQVDVDVALDLLRTSNLTDNAFVVNRQGMIAAYRSHNDNQVRDRDVSYRPDFLLAKNGTSTVYPAVDGNTGERGIYLTAPVRRTPEPDAPSIGGISVKISAEKLDALLATWTGGPAVLISPHGVIFGSNQSSWLFRLTGQVTEERLKAIRASRQYGKVFENPQPPALPFDVKSAQADIEGQHYILRSFALGWNDPAGEWVFLLFDKQDPWWIRRDASTAFPALAGLIALLWSLWLFNLARNTVLQDKINKELNDSQRRLREITDNAPVAVFQSQVVGEDACELHFISLRAGIILGVEPEILFRERARLLENVYPEDRERYEAEVRRCIAAGLPWNFEFRVNTGDKPRWVHSAAYPLAAADGRVNYNGFLVDITERIEALAEVHHARHIAEEATRMKSDFLANMSHEIRTPMNAVIGLSHLALKTELDARQRDYLKKIQQSGQHLLGIINDILDFSKIEAGKLSVEHAPLDLNKVLENVASLIADKTQSKGLELVIDVGLDVPNHLVGDPLRLGQVLINYANNAVKFTEQGEISIIVRKLSEAEGDVLLRFGVKDTGIGLSSEQIGRLFKSFQQADSSISRKYGGTGLGLAISKNLAELMGGTVGVESEIGSGSTFWFTAKLGKGKSPGNHLQLRPDLRNRRILVVDDNYSARVVLSEMLASLSFDVESVASGAAAIRRIQEAVSQQRPFEIAFLDWQMPGMDGVETAKALKKLHLNPAPHLVMVTGYGREEAIKGADDAGIADVLFKPVTGSIVYDLMMGILSKDARAAGSDRNVPASSTEAKLASIAGARVLLVEDNELNQQVASELLGYAGFIVEIAENGQEAVDKVQSQTQPYDIVLMDIQMPVMDGITATRLLRSQPQYADLPILALTANALQSDHEKCLAAGMNAHLSKPIEPDELWRALRRWVRPRTGPWTLPAFRTEPVIDAAQAKQPPDDILPQAIAGLDMEAGLRCVLGNKTFYISMLRKFCAGQRDFAAQFGSAIAGGDAETAERLAHTLTGVSGNIGAKDVSAAAEALSGVVRECRKAKRPLTPAEVEMPLVALLSVLDGLLTALEKHFPSSKFQRQSSPTIGKAELKDICLRLQALLAGDNPEAESFYAEHAEILDAAFPGRSGKIASSIASFDFEPALDALQQAMKQAGIKGNDDE